MKAPRTVTSCIVRSAELRSGRSKTIIRRRRTGVHIHLLLWFLKRDCSLSITMAILFNRLWTSLKCISALQLKQYSWAFVRATTKFVTHFCYTDRSIDEDTVYTYVNPFSRHFLSPPFGCNHFSLSSKIFKIYSRVYAQVLFSNFQYSPMCYQITAPYVIFLIPFREWKKKECKLIEPSRLEAFVKNHPHAPTSCFPTHHSLEEQGELFDL